MANLRDRYLQEKAKLAELTAQYPEGYLVMMSVPSDTYNTKGGVTMEVPVDIAARCLMQATHRIATEAEVEAFRTNQRELAKRIAVMDFANTRNASALTRIDPPLLGKTDPRHLT